MIPLVQELMSMGQAGCLMLPNDLHTACDVSGAASNMKQQSIGQDTWSKHRHPRLS